ncbi:MAG: hypothetical protein JSR92_20185 [Proteobacteria bacterium]|nr:hypothetical protein [Pseudomonadota bacterium]
MSMQKIYPRDPDGKYFTGIPCKRGHLSKRYATGACIECVTRPEETDRRRMHYHRIKKDPKWIAKRRDRLDVTRKRLLPVPTRPDPGFCECCGKPPSGKFKHLALDHDHVSNKFRGWLCNGCNRAIGILGTPSMA